MKEEQEDKGERNPKFKGDVYVNSAGIDVNINTKFEAYLKITPKAWMNIESSIEKYRDSQDEEEMMEDVLEEFKEFSNSKKMNFTREQKRELQKVKRSIKTFLLEEDKQDHPRFIRELLINH